MTLRSVTPTEFAQLRPRLRALLELHRAAQTEEARAELANLFEDAFLTTAWHVARDLLDNGWAPGFAPAAAHQGGLRLVVDEDAA
jgi:hypothetical protein